MTDTADISGIDDTTGASDAAPAPATDAAPAQSAVWSFPAKTCRVTGFLGTAAAGELLDRVLAVPVADLRVSALAGGKVHPQIRRSLTGRDFRAPELEAAILDVLEAVELAVDIPCGNVELDYTLAVHNDGDFYGPHQDRGSVSSDRLITFVYYLHRTPRPFTGGQLRIFDGRTPGGAAETPTSDGLHTWRDWEPDHDTIVFFDPSAYHEVRPVDCPSHDQGDSRFTITGWFYPLASG
jgi:hypothetical protein